MIEKWDSVEKKVTHEEEIKRTHGNISLYERFDERPEHRFFAMLELASELGCTDEAALRGLRKLLEDSIRSLDELLEGGE